MFLINNLKMFRVSGTTIKHINEVHDEIRRRINYVDVYYYLSILCVYRFINVFRFPVTYTVQETVIITPTLQSLKVKLIYMLLYVKAFTLPAFFFVLVWKVVWYFQRRTLIINVGKQSFEKIIWSGKNEARKQFRILSYVTGNFVIYNCYRLQVA
jgi:hypothetical protein